MSGLVQLVGEGGYQNFTLTSTDKTWLYICLFAGIVGIAFVLVHAASRSISHPIHALASDVEAIIRFSVPERAARSSRSRVGSVSGGRSPTTTGPPPGRALTPGTPGR